MSINSATTLNKLPAELLRPEESENVFKEAARSSVVQSLVRRIPVGESGNIIPMVATKPTANWVEEAGQKPATDMSMQILQMAPKKLAALTVVSAEVARRNPGGYVDEFYIAIAEAFARAFDYAALHNLNGTGTGTGPFASHLGKTTKAITLGTASADAGGLYGDVVSGMKLLTTAGKRLTGFALDSTMEADFLAQTDKNGRPLFVPSDLGDTTALARGGSLLGRSTFMADNVKHPGDSDKTVGFMGDFSKAAWGVVNDISFRISTETAVTIGGQLVSAFEHNLVVIMAEAEYGFVVADTEAFVKIKEA